MAELTVVKGNLVEQGWRNAVLVRDEATGKHYAVSTSTEAPWAPDFRETLVFDADENGSVESIDPVHHIAGGRDMDQDEAMADLSARLDDNVLITPEQAEEYGHLKFDEQGQDFITWLTAGGGALV